MNQQKLTNLEHIVPAVRQRIEEVERICINVTSHILATYLFDAEKRFQADRAGR